MDLPIVDLDVFRTQPQDSPAVQAECRKAAEALITFGALVLHDSRVSEEDNEVFLDLLEDYFAQPETTLKQDERPEVGYQVGVTLENTETPKCAVDEPCLDVIARLAPEERPLDIAGHQPDPKCRFFWRVVEEPPYETAFPGLNAPNVVPTADAAIEARWTRVMDQWGGSMKAAVSGAAEMAAIGLGLPAKTFTDAGQYGPHLLAPTASDLQKYGKLDTILAGFHTDLNFLTIHGRSRFPGLHIWARNTGRRIAVSIPPGRHLLVQAGKQLEHLSGGLIKAGYHEVVVNAQTQTAMARRQQEAAERPLIRISSTFFWHLASDFDLAPLPALAAEAQRVRVQSVAEGRDEGAEVAYPAMKVGQQVQNLPQRTMSTTTTTTTATKAAKAGEAQIESGLLKLTVAYDDKLHETYKYSDYLPVYDEKTTFPPLQPFDFIDRGLVANKQKVNLLGAEGVQVTTLTPLIGTEIRNLQLSQLNDQQKDELALLVAERGVVVFRDQDFKDIGVEKQKAFARYFGPLHIHPVGSHVKDHIEVHNIYLGPDNKYRARTHGERLNSITYHSDVSFEHQSPGLTLLALLNVPPTGGDTAWSSQTVAYSRLSQPIRTLLEGLRAEHSGFPQAENARRDGKFVRREPVLSEHPIVRVHPATGQKGLFINAGFTKRIIGLKKEESEALLNLLFQHIANGQDFQVRVKWEAGTVALWDNRVTTHTAISDYDVHNPQEGLRHGIRLTTLADKPTGVHGLQTTW